MKLLLRSNLRFMAATPWSVLTAWLGITLGVASTAAVHLLSLAVSDNLQAARPSHLRGVTHIAESPGADMNDYFELRRRWRQSQRRQAFGPPNAEGRPVQGDGALHWLDEVEFMTPIVEGQWVSGERRLQVVGADWLGGGAPPEVASVRRAVAADASLGLETDEVLQLNGERWTVAKVLNSGVSDGLFMDIGDALALLQRSPDGLSFVALRLADPWASLRTWLERLLPGLSAGLPSTAQPVSEQRMPAANLQEGSRLALSPEESAALVPLGFPDWRLRPVVALLPEQQFAKAILFNLGALGMLALLVAWFLIYQVCVLWLRRQETLMLRLNAIGFSSAKLMSGFLASIAALGAIATLLGILGGYGLAALLVRISTAGFDALPTVQMSSIVVVKALVSGLGVALAGAWWAFAKQDSRQGGLLRSGGLLAAPRACVAFTLRLLRPPRLGICLGAALIAIGMGFAETGLYGGFAAILAAGLIASVLVAPLLRLLRTRLHKAGGNLLVRLAMREATWHEGDLSAALGALILAVGTSVGVSLMVDSFEQDFVKMLDQRLAHETFLELPNQDSERLAATLRRAHPDALVQAYGRISTRLDGQAVEVGYTDFSAAEAARYGYPRALAEDEAFASESLLARLGLTVGDTIDWNPPSPSFPAADEAAANEGPRANSGLAENAPIADGSGATLRIVHEFSGFGEATPRLLMNAQAAARRFGTLGFDRISLSGINAATLENWLQDWAPGAQVHQQAAMRRAALDIFDRTFAITRALTLLALIIAVVGLHNAMTALRLNQKASATLLRALGLSAKEQRRLALIRGGVLGACAILLALPLGLFIGFALCEVINPRAFGWSLDLSISTSAWAWPALLGFAAAVAASLMPTPGEAKNAS